MCRHLFFVLCFFSSFAKANVATCTKGDLNHCHVLELRPHANSEHYFVLNEQSGGSPFQTIYVEDFVTKESHPLLFLWRNTGWIMLTSMMLEGDLLYVAGGSVGTENSMLKIGGQAFNVPYQYAVFAFVLNVKDKKLISAPYFEPHNSFSYGVIKKIGNKVYLASRFQHGHSLLVLDKSLNFEKSISLDFLADHIFHFVDIVPLEQCRLKILFSKGGSIAMPKVGEGIVDL